MSPRPPSDPTTEPRRSFLRQSTLWGAGLLAAAGGLAWQLGLRPSNTPQTGVKPLPEDFWSLQFDQPEGNPLTLSNFRGRPLLVNFWATWCPPCVKELPELARFWEAFKADGGEVLGLAVDSPSSVQRFLKNQFAIPFPVGLAGLSGTQLSQSLGNTEGGLPFTVMINGQGQVIQTHRGATEFQQLQAWASAMKA